jgi:hypothetical protein
MIRGDLMGHHDLQIAPLEYNRWRCPSFRCLPRKRCVRKSSKPAVFDLQSALFFGNVHAYELTAASLDWTLENYPDAGRAVLASIAR